jgi:hypothetical protein
MTADIIDLPGVAKAVSHAAPPNPPSTQAPETSPPRSMKPQPGGGIAIRPDPSFRVRAALALVAIAASLLFGWHALLAFDGRATFVFPIGLSRIAEAARTAPALKPYVRLALLAEHAATAMLCAYMALALLRNVPPPRPEQGEQIVFYSRQNRLALCWRWLLGAAVALVVGHFLATQSTAILRALWQMTGANMLALLGGKQHLYFFQIGAGLCETLALVWLWHSLFVAVVPFARAYFVVVVSPKQLGFSNRIMFGDGRFEKNSGSIRADAVEDVRRDASFLRRTLLGLSVLRVTFKTPRGLVSMAFDSPGSVAETLRLSGYLMSGFLLGVGLPGTRGTFGRNNLPPLP